ncbi:hypothetical protein [Levyella massiliensis]|uniref:hypothetical protein n=1 Tax=Levyella massiliensis TaxID=938289 RepID=UPI0024AE5B5D|nr:hypothetical protein [Levyella massiliensis]
MANITIDNSKIKDIKEELVYFYGLEFDEVVAADDVVTGIAEYYPECIANVEHIKDLYNAVAANDEANKSWFFAKLAKLMGKASDYLKLTFGDIDYKMADTDSSALKIGRDKFTVIIPTVEWRGSHVLYGVIDTTKMRNNLLDYVMQKHTYLEGKFDVYAADDSDEVQETIGNDGDKYTVYSYTDDITYEPCFVFAKN